MGDGSIFTFFTCVGVTVSVISSPDNMQQHLGSTIISKDHKYCIIVAMLYKEVLLLELILKYGFEEPLNDPQW